MKHVLLIIALWLLSTFVSAQQWYGVENLPAATAWCGDAGYGGATTPTFQTMGMWDFTVEVAIQNAKLSTDGQSFEFDIYLSAPVFWTDVTTIAVTTMNFDFNKDVLSTDLNAVTFDLNTAESEPGFPLGNLILSEVANVGGDIYWSLNLQALGTKPARGDTRELFSFETADEGEGGLLAHVTWKLKPGASGTTQVVLRKCDVARGSGAATANMKILCLVQTGNANIQIGSETPVLTPKVNDLARVDGAPIGKADGGSPVEYVATATENPTGWDWTLTQKSNNSDVSSWLTENSDKATVNWPAGTFGEYDLCVTASNAAGASQPVCSTIFICPAEITATLEATSACIGEMVTLSVKNWPSAVGALNSATYKWTNSTTSAQLGTAATVDVTAAATPTSYAFAAATATGGCPVSGTIAVTGNPLPAAGTLSVTARATPISTTYYAGDILNFSVTNKANYDYEWTINSVVNASTTNTCQIYGATEASYAVSLKVTDRNTGCSNTVSTNLTKRTDCVPDVTIGGTGTICSGGGVSIINVSAAAAVACSQPLHALLYNAGTNAKLDSIGLSENPSGAFVVKAAGNYRVELHTQTGVVRKNVEIIPSGYSVLQPVTAPTKITVRPGNQTYLMAGGDMQSVLWEPADELATSNTIMYPLTKAINSPVTFYVYGTDSYGCVSEAKTDVEIGAQALSVATRVEGGTPCAGGNFRISAIVTGGSGNYKYTWTNDFRNVNGYTDSVSIITTNPEESATLERMVFVEDLGTGLAGMALAEVNVSTTVAPKLTLKIGTGNDSKLCDNETITAEVQSGTAPSSYQWYVKKNPGSYIPVATTTNTLSLSGFESGDYQVWVAAKAGTGANTCHVDTLNTGISLSLKGFTLAWDPGCSVDYISGQTIRVGARVTGGNDPRFTWSASSTLGRLESIDNKANPNWYKLEAASASQYTFMVTVNDADGCSKSETKVINRKSGATDTGLKLLVNNKNINFCTGGSAVMSATASGGTPPYKLVWREANGGNVELLATTGSTDGISRFTTTNAALAGKKIVVEATDAGALMRRDTITLTNTATPAPVISAGADITIARGTSTWLMGEVVSGTIVQNGWVWSGSLANDGTQTTQYPQTAVLNSDATFVAYATDGSGCTSVPDSVQVRVGPVGQTLGVEIASIGYLCNQSQIGLTAKITPDQPIVSWKWQAVTENANINPVFDNDAISSPKLTMNSSNSGTVYIYVTVQNGTGLSARYKRSVSVSGAMAPELALTLPEEACEGTSVTASAASGELSAYKWYVDGELAQEGSSKTFVLTSETPDGPEYKHIRVSATSAAGCPAKADVEDYISVNPKPIIQWAAVGADMSDAGVDAGDPVKAKAELTTSNPGTGPSYTWNWTHTGSGAVTYTDNGATSALNGTAQPDIAYTFQVQVTDNKGCVSDPIVHTSIVPGDQLFVQVRSVYGDYCTGGAAVLRAEVIGLSLPEGDLTYQWYRGADETLPVGNSRELVVNPSEITDSYWVKVVSSSTSKEGRTDNNLFTLTADASKTAPTVTTKNLTIPRGTKTALIASAVPNAPATSITGWFWTDSTKIAAGENRLQYPYTTVLTGTTNFSAYAVDNNNCVGRGDLTVSTMTVTPPADGGDIMVKVDPAAYTICSGNSLQLTAKTWSTGGTPTYTWLPETDTYLSADNIANPVFNEDQAMVVPGTYSYVVQAVQGALTAAARVDVTVKSGILPELLWDRANISDCAGGRLSITVNNSAVIDRIIWEIVGVETKETRGDHFITWPAVTTTQSYTVNVTAQTTAGCMTQATLTDIFPVNPAQELGDVVVSDSCGFVKIYTNVGSEPTHSWTLNAATQALFTADDTRGDTLYLTPKKSFNAAKGAYTVEVGVTPQGGGCQSVATVTGNVYFKPVIRIDGWTPPSESAKLPYAMVEKGGSVALSISTDPDISYIVGTNSTIEWVASHATVTPPSAPTTTVQNAMQDDQIVLRAINKDLPACMSTDTMPVYLYPEAPQLTIDTVDGSVVQAALHLTGGEKYTVWSREWDPYCLTAVYTGDQMYHAEATATNITASDWKVPVMDTLEYFYATASRELQGRTWESKATSDTVGYYLFDVNINASTTLANDNYMAVYFDFAAMGVPTTVELGERLAKTSSSMMFNISYFDYITQKTVQTTYVTTNPGGAVATAFTLNDKGIVVIRPAQKYAGTFLQYGRLPRTEFVIRRTNPTGTANTNWGYILPQKTHQLNSYEDFVAATADLGSVAANIQDWNFATQKPNMVTIMLNRPYGTKPRLLPLMFIKINPAASVTTYIWK